MASLGRKVFRGKSGTAYRFKVYPLGTRFRKLSGVYVVANRCQGLNGGRRLVALYVGHTEDFSQPFDQHLKAKDFVNQGGKLHLRSIRRRRGIPRCQGKRPGCVAPSGMQRLKASAHIRPGQSGRARRRR